MKKSTIFWLLFQPHASVLCTLDILSKYERFYIFFFQFLANRLSVGKIISIPADIRYFGDILVDKFDILFLDFNITL